MASIKVDKDSKYIKRIFDFIYSNSFSLATEEYNMPDQSFYISETKHDRDLNAAINIRNNTVGTTGINACGDMSSHQTLSPGISIL